MRCRRGVAGIIGVMLLSVVAITFVAAFTVWSQYKLGWDRWRLAGQIWAEWVHALDRATIPFGWVGGDWTAIRDDLYGGATDGLPVSGLGGDGGLQFGASVARVPMQFHYVEVPPAPDLPAGYCASPGLIGAPPEEQCLHVGAARLRPQSRGRLDALRRGIIDGGLGTVAIADAGGTLIGSESITDFEDLLVTRFGGPFLAGDIVAIAHVSIPRQERALHHRAPAGRPDLAGMNADLDMGGHDMSVEGRPPLGVAPEDSLDIETGGFNQVTQVDVHFRAPPTFGADDLEPAVRADFVVSRGLSLVSTNLERAHEIGVRPGALPPGDEMLHTLNARFSSAETTCDDVAAGEHCVTTTDLDTADLDTADHLRVHREDTGTGITGSGVRTNAAHIGHLNIISGVCHGCTGFGP